MRPIDGDALKRKIEEMQAFEPEYAFHFLNNAQNPSTEWECVEDLIENAPTIEAEPVRHGHCYVDSVGYERCSVCNESEFNMRYFRFCPHCGARMDGGGQNAAD